MPIFLNTNFAVQRTLFQFIDPRNYYQNLYKTTFGNAPSSINNPSDALNASLNKIHYADVSYLVWKLKFAWGYSYLELGIKTVH